MNDHVKDLATKVGISVEYLSNTKQWVLIEALACEIIRECITVAQPEDSYRDDWFHAKTDSVNKIKTRFGVKDEMDL